MSDRKDPLVGFSWAPEKRLLAVATRSGKCRFWDAETGQFGLSFDVHPAGCSSPVWSPDGKTLMIVTSQGTVQMHSSQDGARLGTFFSLPFGPLFLVSREGHFRIIGNFLVSQGGARGADKEILYVADRNDRQQRLLDHVEMSSQYGWENDPSQIQLVP